MISTKRMLWWVSLIAAITMPFSVLWGVENLGGYITNSVSYDNFHLIVQLSFLISAGLTLRVLFTPSNYLGLRFSLGFACIIIYGFIGVFAPRLTCGEDIQLHKLGSGVKINSENSDSCS